MPFPLIICKKTGNMPVQPKICQFHGHYAKSTSVFTFPHIFVCQKNPSLYFDPLITISTASLINSLG